MESSIAVRSNLQIIQQAYADFSQGKIDNIVRICADNVVWGTYKVPGSLASGTFIGKEGVQEFFANLASQVTYSIFEPREYIVQNDRIIVLGRHAGLVRTTGKSFDHDWCMSFWMKEGKIERFFVFTDSYEQARAFAET